MRPAYLQNQVWAAIVAAGLDTCSTDDDGSCYIEYHTGTMVYQVSGGE